MFPHFCGEGYDNALFHTGLQLKNGNKLALTKASTIKALVFVPVECIRRVNLR